MSMKSDSCEIVGSVLFFPLFLSLSISVSFHFVSFRNLLSRVPTIMTKTWQKRNDDDNDNWIYLQSHLKYNSFQWMLQFSFFSAIFRLQYKLGEISSGAHNATDPTTIGLIMLIIESESSRLWRDFSYIFRAVEISSYRKWNISLARRNGITKTIKSTLGSMMMLLKLVLCTMNPVALLSDFKWLF